MGSMVKVTEKFSGGGRQINGSLPTSIQFKVGLTSLTRARLKNTSLHLTVYKPVIVQHDMTTLIYTVKKVLIGYIAT